jgi:hypothetical protein
VRSCWHDAQAVEEWKYSDLKRRWAKGLGAVVAQWLVGNLPSGVEVRPVAEQSARLGDGAWPSDRNVMSAASLALSAAAVRRSGCPRACRSPIC